MDTGGMSSGGVNTSYSSGKWYDPLVDVTKKIWEDIGIDITPVGTTFTWKNISYTTVKGGYKNNKTGEVVKDLPGKGTSIAGIPTGTLLIIGLIVVVYLSVK